MLRRSRSDALATQRKALHACAGKRATQSMREPEAGLEAFSSLETATKNLETAAYDVQLRASQRLNAALLSALRAERGRTEMLESVLERQLADAEAGLKLSDPAGHEPPEVARTKSAPSGRALSAGPRRSGLQALRRLSSSSSNVRKGSIDPRRPVSLQTGGLLLSSHLTRSHAPSAPEGPAVPPELQSWPEPAASPMRGRTAAVERAPPRPDAAFSAALCARMQRSLRSELHRLQEATEAALLSAGKGANGATSKQAGSRRVALSPFEPPCDRRETAPAAPTFLPRGATAA